MSTETPVLKLRVGDTVLVRGHESEGPRKVVSLYDQERMAGGVRLDRVVDGFFKSWNEEELIRVGTLNDPNWVCYDCKAGRHQECSTVPEATTKYGCTCALRGHESNRG